MFGVALAAYAAVTVLCLIASDSWSGLLLAPLLGALPFVSLRILRPFAGVFVGLVLGALCLLMGSELLFRARYFGPDAIAHFTGYSPLPPTLVPGFVAPADDPELGYVFKPGARERLNGYGWEINEQGFRDRGFVEAKAPDVFRILVLGDSFALGNGVALEDRFSSRLATLLADEQQGRRLEIYNLGLAGLGLAQLSHLMETSGERYDADLMLLGLRASQLHEKAGFGTAEAARDFAVRRARIAEGFSFPRRYAFVLNVQREAVRNGLARVRSLGKRITGGSRNGKRETKEPAVGEATASPFEQLVERAAAFSQRRDVPVVLVALRKMEFRSDTGLRATLANRALDGDASRRRDHEEIERITAREGVPFIDTYDAFDPDARRGDYIIFPGDAHPNAAGHERYAEAIATWLRDHSGLQLRAQPLEGKDHAAVGEGERI